MSDPLAKLTSLVNRQQTVIEAARAAAKKLAAERAVAIEVARVQPTPTAEPLPNVSS